MLSNFRLAVRTLAKTPFVTAIAILSLALGIGANTAIFSLFDRMLLRPLPVPDPVALVNLGTPRPKPGSNSCNQAGDCEWVFSYPMFRDLERVQTAFTGLAAHCLMGVNLAARGQTTSGDGVTVSGSYFPTLGLQPAAGRLLAPDDDRTPGAHPVVVLSHAYWVSHFAERADVVGSPITVNGTTLTIIGVAPRGFEGTTLGTRPHVFVPLSMREVLLPGWKGLDNRRSYWAYVFGRRKPGVSLGAGPGVARGAVPRHHHRRRGAAADRDERSDNAALQVQAADRRAWCPRPERGDGSKPGRRCCCCSASPPSSWSRPAPTSPTCCWRGPPGATSRWPSGSRSAPAAGRSWASCWSNRARSHCSAARPGCWSRAGR